MLNDNTQECKTSSPSTYLCKVLHMWNRGAANKQPVAASWWRVSRATTKERQEKTNKRGSNTWGFPWRVLVHKFRVFFWRCSKRGFVLLLHFFFFSLFLLSLLRVFQWHQQLPSGCWGGALGSIPSLYKSQRDVTGSISQPPSSSSSHPHLTHPPIRPSDHLSTSSLSVSVSSFDQRRHLGITRRNAFASSFRRFGYLTSSTCTRTCTHARARTHMYTRVVGCCRAPVLLRGDVGGWHDWDSQRIPPLPPVFAFSLRLVQQVDFSLKKKTKSSNCVRHRAGGINSLSHFKCHDSAFSLVEKRISFEWRFGFESYSGSFLNFKSDFKLRQFHYLFKNIVPPTDTLLDLELKQSSCVFLETDWVFSVLSCRISAFVKIDKETCVNLSFDDWISSVTLEGGRSESCTTCSWTALEFPHKMITCLFQQLFILVLLTWTRLARTHTKTELGIGKNEESQVSNSFWLWKCWDVCYEMTTSLMSSPTGEEIKIIVQWLVLQQHQGVELESVLTRKLVGSRIVRVHEFFKASSGIDIVLKSFLSGSG